jgi:hypothetical protein
MDPLKVIFRNNHFIIPANQRGYSWKKQHAKALLDDLELMGGKSHYMGTIIVTYAGQEFDFQDDESRDYIKGFILDDGQQRLTTFLLLVHSLVSQFEAIGDSENQHAVELRSYLCYWHNGKHLRIQNQQQDLQQYLRHLLLNESRPSSKTSPMIALHEVYRYFSDFVAELDLEELIDWKLRVTAQAKFILVNLSEQNIDRYLAFDAINSRGLPLTEFDKVKNFCVLLVNRRNGLRDLRPENSWYKALESLEHYEVTTRKGESTFIAESHAVFFNDRVGTDRIHREFVRKFSKLLIDDDSSLEGQLKSYVETWEKFSEAFGFIISPKRKTKSTEKATAGANDWLTNIDHMNLPGITRTILCAGLLTYSKAEFERLAKWCEIYTFRVHGLAQRRTDKNSQGIIALAHSILFHQIPLIKAGEQLCKWLDDIAPLKTAFNFLTDGGVKYYFDTRMKGWGHCYYFLYQYEISTIHGGASPISWEDSKEKQKSSIEHILPQTHRDGGWWQDKWPDENEADQWKHRLGNIVLTNGNSVLGQKSFPQKLNDGSSTYYYNHNSATNSEKLISRYSDGSTWYKANILKREYDLVKFALNRWTIGCCTECGNYKFPEEYEAFVDNKEIVLEFTECTNSSGIDEIDDEPNNETAEMIDVEMEDSEESPQI